MPQERVQAVHADQVPKVIPQLPDVVVVVVVELVVVDGHIAWQSKL